VVVGAVVAAAGGSHIGKRARDSGVRNDSLLVVIPAKAGIHLDSAFFISKQNGFPLSRE
jgi:hypothetical protein